MYFFYCCWWCESVRQTNVRLGTKAVVQLRNLLEWMNGGKCNGNKQSFFFLFLLLLLRSSLYSCSSPRLMLLWLLSVCPFVRRFAIAKCFWFGSVQFSWIWLALFGSVACCNVAILGSLVFSFISCIAKRRSQSNISKPTCIECLLVFFSSFLFAIFFGFLFLFALMFEIIS